jgi:hypothetical protein
MDRDAGRLRRTNKLPLELHDATTDGVGKMFDDLDALLLETTSTLGTRGMTPRRAGRAHTESRHEPSAQENDR